MYLARMGCGDLWLNIMYHNTSPLFIFLGFYTSVEMFFVLKYKISDYPWEFLGCPLLTVMYLKAVILNSFYTDYTSGMADYRILE